MTTEQIIFDTITFKESIDNALARSYEGNHYMVVNDIFEQEVTVYNGSNGETMVMSDKKDVIWGANNSRGSQARLVEWLMSSEDNK